MNIFFFLPSSSPLENSLPVRNFRVFISIRIEAAFHARYASRIYSANSSIRGNERYGKRNTGWKREKILLSIIFLARLLSLSCSPLPEEQISYHLAPFIYIYPNGPATFPLGKIKYLAALAVVCPAGSNTVRKSTADILYSFETRVLGIEITGREGEQECYVLHALSRNFAPIKVQRGKKSANKRIVLPVAPRLKRSATRHHFNYRNIFPTGRAD